MSVGWISNLRYRGISFALASAALFGASVPVSKLLLGTGIPANLLAGLLYLGSGLGLIVTISFRRFVDAPATEAPLRRADMPRLVVIIGIGGVVAPLLLMWGLARTDAASASLLLNVESVVTLGLAWLVFNENANLQVVLG